jgi:hypothetical protein
MLSLLVLLPLLAAYLALHSPLVGTAGADGPTLLAVWGSTGSGTGQFNFAHHLAVTSTGTVYVGDLLNNRVQRFSSSGAFLNAWSRPSADGVAIAPDGSVYVTGNNLIARYSATGTFMSSWGTAGSGNGQFSSPVDVAVNAFSGSGAFLLAFGTLGTGPGQWNSPGRPCLDPDGSLIVPDQGNHRIQVYTQAGEFRLTWGSHGAAPGQFDHPTCVASDASGNLYVMDKGNARVQKFGGIVTAASRTSWGAIKALYRE